MQGQVGHVAPHVEQPVETFFGRESADRDRIGGLARRDAGAKLGQVHARIDDRVGVAVIELPKSGRGEVAVGHQPGCPAHGEPVDQASQPQVDAPRAGQQEHTAGRVHPVRHARSIAQGEQIRPERVGDDRIGADVGDGPLQPPESRKGQAGQLGIGSVRVEAAEQEADVVTLHERSPKLEDRSLTTAQCVRVTVCQDDLHGAVSFFEPG